MLNQTKEYGTKRRYVPFVRKSRKIKPFSLVFRLRKGYRTGQQTLLCRIRVNGEVSSDFSSGVIIPADFWDVKMQNLTLDHPQYEEIAGRLAIIRDEFRKIIEQQTTLSTVAGFTHLSVTVDSVKRQWISGESMQPSLGIPLTKLYADFLADLNKLPLRERKAAGTMQRYKHGGVLLAEYLRLQGTPSLSVEGVTVGWGRQYFDWLRSRPMKRDPAAKHIGVLRMALQHALEYDRILKNPLFELRPKRDKPKRIVYLPDEQLVELSSLPLKASADYARKWALLMCYTGLDYNDAIEVVENYSRYRQPVAGSSLIKSKIVYQRLKANDAPDWGECHIPVLPEAEALFAEAHTWAIFELQVINRYLHVFEGLLGMPFSFTTKVCRKTAGAIFLKRNCPVEVVQKVLGHKSQKTTENHYISMPGQVVDQQIQRMNAAHNHSSSCLQ